MTETTGVVQQSDVAMSLHVTRQGNFAVKDKTPLISSQVVRGLMRGMDLMIAGVAGFIIASLYVTDLNIFQSPIYFVAVLGTAALAVLLFELIGLYKVPSFSMVIKTMPHLFFGWLGAFAGLIAVMFFFKSGHEFSRVWLATWFGAGSLALLGGRFLIASLVAGWRTRGRLYRRALVYGTGPIAKTVLSQLEADPDSDIAIAGLFDDRGDERAPGITQGYPLLGKIDDLIQFVRSTRIDTIILAIPVSAEDRISAVLNEISDLPVEIKLPACATSVRLSPRAYSHIGEVPMIDLMEKPMTDWGAVSKWVFDKVVSLLALILLAPVMAGVAIAIRLDSKGPILFRQRRYGFNNELIEVFKFRSMYVDKCDANASRLVTKDDPRVTPVGQFIRKTSLDELPQLLNVLTGELSLVGPRPHALQAKAADRLYDEVVEGYFKRHKVKPGITGWAQINGWRGETDTSEKIEKRVEHDLYYIENWSLFLDLYILVMTPFALFKTENAY